MRLDRQDIKRCRAEADAFWAERREGDARADGGADEKRAQEVRLRCDVVMVLVLGSGPWHRPLTIIHIHTFKGKSSGEGAAGRSAPRAVPGADDGGVRGRAGRPADRGRDVQRCVCRRWLGGLVGG